MGAAHTPGPWRILECRGDHEIRIGYGPVANWLASVWMNEDEEDDPEAEADARLIAAAPAMLEALEYLISLGGGDCLDMARAAIAKAKGEA